MEKLANERIKKMIFEFEKKRICNKDRYYPSNENAMALLSVFQRAVLLTNEIEFLKKKGWDIRII